MDGKITIGAIVLAAGMSKRMGTPKLLLPLHGKSLIQRTVGIVVKHFFSPICVVTGHNQKEILEQLKEYPEIDIVYNAQYSEGMSTSLVCGIQHMLQLTDATMIFLADQPFISDCVIQSMVKKYLAEKDKGGLIVRPSYQGVLGHPILIDSSLYNEFCVITGDVGGKYILKRYIKQTSIIAFENAIWGKDIDTRGDYLNMKKHISKNM